MTEKGMVVIGAGKRVREVVLPVVERLSGLYKRVGLYARSEREISVQGRRIEVRDLKKIGDEELAGVELVYLSVSKDGVPAALKSLERIDRSRLDLLIETPVVLFKHLGCVPALKSFRNVWVAEDCSCLPFYEPVRETLERGEIGKLEEIHFHRSAYKYHGVAMLKALIGCRAVKRAFRKRTGAGAARRTFYFGNRCRGIVEEPRDYAQGWFVLQGSGGALTDNLEARPGALVVEPVLEGDRCVGFRAGGAINRLDSEEQALMAEGLFSAPVTARMEAMKRVGLYRLLRRIHETGEGYPLLEGLDDMVVDYFLEKLGFYPGTRLACVKTSTGLVLLKTLTRLARSISKNEER